MACGHVLCTDCVRDFGTYGTEDRKTVVVENCSLHPRDTIVEEGPSQTKIKLPPQSTGLRILVLDG